MTYLIYICLNLELFNGLEHLAKILGYFFLAFFVLMGTVNAFLIVQIRAKTRTLQLENNIFDQEKRRLLLILFFFELSYFSRFIWDEWLITSKKRFLQFFVADLVMFLDGLSFLALLILHRKSFINSNTEKT